MDTEHEMSAQIAAEFFDRLESAMRYAGYTMIGAPVITALRLGGLNDDPVATVVFGWCFLTGCAVAWVFRRKSEEQGVETVNSGVGASLQADLSAVISLAPEAAWDRIATLLLQERPFSQNAILNAPSGSMLSRSQYQPVCDAMRTLDLIGESLRLTDRGRGAFQQRFPGFLRTDPPTRTAVSPQNVLAHTGHGA
jgi:hypothetical protein